MLEGSQIVSTMQEGSGGQHADILSCVQLVMDVRNEAKKMQH